MTSYVTPKKNTAYKFYVALVDQSNTKLTKANPTIASGDFKVSIDGGAFNNLATLPSANPASGRAVMIDLSSSEMNGDNIVVQCVDAAGAEWCDLILNIQTSARQIDDLAFPATTGRSIVVDASGLVDANMVKAGPTGSGTAQTAKDIGGAVPAAAAGASGGLLISGSNSGTTTFAALTVTGSFTISDGLLIARSTSNASAITATGNGTGNGAVFTSGSGATGDGAKFTAASTDGSGLNLTGTGSGDGLRAASTGGVGNGINATGVTAGMSVNGATNGIGFLAVGAGTGEGFKASSGTGAAAVAMTLQANGTGASHGMNVSGKATGHGALFTSGTGATGDGVKAVAASTNGNGIEAVKSGSGSDILASITGNLSGSVGSVTAGVTLAASAVQAIWDALTSALTTVGSIGKLLVDNINATISSRMATYTQPTGFLAATFPGTVASTTNITAGTITTVTNLTNAPTAGDLTAAMKASVQTAADAAVTANTLINAIAGYIDTEVATIVTQTSAASIRSAVGLASANLDTQLAAIAGYIDTEITTLLSQTSAASIRAAVGLASANLDTQLDALPTAVEVRDAVWAKTLTELTGVPASNAAVIDALCFLFMALRNLRETTATSDKITNNAGAAIGTAVVSDDSTTFAKAKYA